MLKTKYQYIHFVKVKCEHMPYTMHSNRSCFVMGTVHYFKPWKKYVIEPVSDYVFDENCLRDIADFLDQLNEKLKGNKNATEKRTTPSSK